jgi:hypothetical protein
MEAFAHSEVTGLVESFTPQVDAKRVANCELAKKLIEMTIEAAWMVAQGSAGLLLPGVGGMFVEPFHQFLPGFMGEFDSQLAEMWPQVIEPFNKADGLKLTKTGQILNSLVGYIIAGHDNGYYKQLREKMGGTIGDIPSADLAEIQEWYKTNALRDPAVPQMAMMMSTAGGKLSEKSRNYC